MEIVDVVDEDLNILEQVPKDEAHKKGLLHKCVVAEVYNSKGEMMLVQQQTHKQDAGQYVSPVGGHVSAGESDEDALRREVDEEIGIKDFEFKLKSKIIFDRFVLGRQENHYFLIYEITCDQVPILGDEAASYKWFTLEELKKQLKTDKKMFGDAFLFLVTNIYPEFLS